MRRTYISFVSSSSRGYHYLDPVTWLLGPFDPPSLENCIDRGWSSQVEIAAGYYPDAVPRFVELIPDAVTWPV
jgi:hypothetical protein